MSPHSPAISSRKRLRGGLGRALGLSLVVLSGGACSTFDADWDAAVRSPRPPETGAGDLSGGWEGFWKSSVNGHDGRLRGIFERVDDEHYEVHFHATFGGVFTFEYEVPILVAREAPGFRFEGQADLGTFAWGLYLYRGRITADEFTARYDCGVDHGIFFMERRGLTSASTIDNSMGP